MKTPDEIKKGLGCCVKFLACVPTMDCCEYCPYIGSCDELEKDALAYIQQLEADNAQQARCIENLTDKLNATNDALPRWISVEERLPDSCENVIVIARYGECAWDVTLGFVLNKVWHALSRDNGEITHWMPLPEPPECKENGGIEE